MLKDFDNWEVHQEYDGDDDLGKAIFCYKNYCPVCGYSTWLIPKKCPECGKQLGKEF